MPETEKDLQSVMPLTQIQSNHNTILKIPKKKCKSKLHEAVILGSWYGSFFTAIFAMLAMRDAVTVFPALAMFLSVCWFTLLTIVNCKE